MFHKIFAMHLQIDWILNILMVQAKNDEERSAICMAKEPELKAQAAALFKSLGMDLSTATGIFYRQALRCHGLPFEVKVDEPNAVTYAAMEAAEKGDDIYGPFDSVADLMRALNA
jgi:DNA-damage-inducible protein J